MIAWPERLDLARTPTPVEPLRNLSDKLGVELLVKRDDLTGAPLTGNKVRKLEFLLADAKKQGADVVITCGGAQSNHCRATAIAARTLGLDSVLVLRTDDPASPPPITDGGNLLLDRLVGAEVRWVSRAGYARRAELFVEIADELRAKGRRPYVIPEGGSNALGAWGYVRAVDELANQIGRAPTTIVYATGSGGTGAGLLAGTRLLGLDAWRVVGVNVCDDRDYFVRVIGDIVDDFRARFGHGFHFDRDALEIVDGYVGRGYAKSRPEELALIRDVARGEGLILDPVYTGKAFYGMTCELVKDRRRFGERIVFVHTGGIFGLFPVAAEIAPLL